MDQKQTRIESCLHKIMLFCLFGLIGVAITSMFVTCVFMIDWTPV